MKKTLIINPGSTSCKFSVFTGPERQAHFSLPFSNHVIQDGLAKINLNITELAGFGVRVVHGGETFRQSTPITLHNLPELEALSSLAPLHNPPAVSVIQQILDLDATALILGVFDTTFHQSIEPAAYTYALPRDLQNRHSIRRYGFHGTACQSVLRQAETYLGHTPSKMIICHLGGGASVTALKNGKSVETSMGFTPIEGLMMVTRSGDTDFGALTHIARQEKLNWLEIENLLNNQSGFLGLTDSTDIKDIVEKAQAGKPAEKLAVSVFVHRIVKYIGSYTAILGGLNALTFSGGIGEGNAYIRQIICQHFAYLGLKIAPQQNHNQQTTNCSLHSPESTVQVLVTPAREDEEIQQQVLDLLVKKT